MKRNLLYIAAVAALGLAACTPGKCDKASHDDVPDQVYTGVLPAADAEGVRYTLWLDYDDEGRDGDYQMVQTYFTTDSTGVVDLNTYATEGDFTVGKTASGKDYLKLEQRGQADVYFVADTDSTLTLTDQSLEPVSTPGMNYTLKKAK